MRFRRTGPDTLKPYSFVTANGRVESIALTTSSGDAQLDAAALRSLEAARFTPASRDGKAVSVCNQQITLHITEPASPP